MGELIEKTFIFKGDVASEASLYSISPLIDNDGITGCEMELLNEKSDNSFSRYVFVNKDGREKIIITDDYESGLTYLSLVGFDKYKSELISNWIQNNIDIHDIHDIKSELLKNINNSRLISCLGILEENPHDKDTDQILEKALSSKDSSVRKNSLIAAFLIGWPKLMMRTKEILETEEDDDMHEFTLKIQNQIQIKKYV